MYDSIFCGCIVFADILGNALAGTFIDFINSFHDETNGITKLLLLCECFIRS